MGNCCDKLFFKPETPQRKGSSVASTSSLSIFEECCGGNEVAEDIGWKGSYMDILVADKSGCSSPLTMVQAEKINRGYSSFKDKTSNKTDLGWIIDPKDQKCFDLQKKLAYEAKEEKERTFLNRPEGPHTSNLLSKDILKTKV